MKMLVLMRRMKKVKRETRIRMDGPQQVASAWGAGLLLAGVHIES